MFVAHYWRFGCPDTEEFDTINAALAFAEWSCADNTAYVETITDEAGTVLYTRDTSDPGAGLLPV
jgi:hypothetical protein